MRIAILLFTCVFVLSGCGTDESVPLNPAKRSGASKRFLYVASGACYGGNTVTTSTPSQVVSAYGLESGAFSHVVADFNKVSFGDSPVGLVDFDKDYLLALVENASGRRIDMIRKDGGGYGVYLTNTTALSAALRSLHIMPDKSILASKSTAIERFGAARTRVTAGANPYVNAPASTCAASATLISSVAALPNGKILYTHAAATPNNKIGLIAAAGYNTTGDCLGAQAAPVTTAWPTAIIYHSSNHVLVGYGASTPTTSNMIMSYDINQTTNVFSNATTAYTDAGVLMGPSAMVEDTATGRVYVANGASNFNTIERFDFNSTTATLTKVEALPFIPSSAFTRCVSGLAVGAQYE